MELNKRFGKLTSNRDPRTSKNSTIHQPSRLEAHDFLISIQPSMYDFHKSKRIWNFGHLH